MFITGAQDSTGHLATVKIKTITFPLLIRILIIWKTRRNSQLKRLNLQKVIRSLCLVMANFMDGEAISRGKWALNPKLAFKSMKLSTFQLKSSDKVMKNKMFSISTSVRILFCFSWQTANYGGPAWKWHISHKKLNSLFLNLNYLLPEINVLLL